MPQVEQGAGLSGHHTVTDISPEHVRGKANNSFLLPGSGRGRSLQDGESSFRAAWRALAIMSLVVFISIANGIFHF